MLNITFPYNGAVLNHRHGIQTAEGLTIQVRGTAPLDTIVKVNGVVAERRNTDFVAKVLLTHPENGIIATAEGYQGVSQHQIRVLWDKFSFPRFRISIDDNSFWCRNLLQERPKYINDNLYLSILKRLHDEFGAKFTLNLFYETPEHDFNLSMLPTDYKSQFEDNSEWMRLTWHAYNEFPDRPYQYASAATVAHDFDLIHSEVCRFAGEKTWAPPTIMHWGEILPSVLPVLVERGVTALSGYFTKNEMRYAVSYGLDEARCAYMNCHDMLKDFKTGIVFSKMDLLVNGTTIDKIIPTLAPQLENPDTAEYIDILTHEQYFWPFYFNYVPDHYERMATALRFLVERGYKGVFQHEGFLGAPKFQE